MSHSYSYQHLIDWNSEWINVILMVSSSFPNPQASVVKVIPLGTPPPLYTCMSLDYQENDSVLQIIELYDKLNLGYLKGEI